MPSTKEIAEAYKLRKGPSVKEIRQTFSEFGIEAWTKLQEVYGDNYLVQGIWVCSDPEWVERLLMQKVHTQVRSVIYKKRREFVPLAAGMLFMDGDDWQKRLMAVMPSFTRQEVEKYSISMLSTLRREWDKQAAGEIQDVYRRLVEINKQHLFEVAYGLDSESEQVEKLADAFIAYKFFRMEPGQRMDFFGLQLKDLPAFFRTRKALKKCEKLETQFIKQLESLDENALNDSPGKGLDWFRRLLGAGFSKSETALEMNHLYSAYNALDYVLTCSVMELAKHPDWQDAIAKEWQNSGIQNDVFSWEHWQSLKKLQSFTKEVLRCYPVSMGISRSLGEDIVLGDKTIKAKQEILIALYPLHHNPLYWDNSNEFDPDRWEQEPAHPFAYIPFLKGSRHCIGRHLAEMNMVLVLGTLLEKFRIVPKSDFPSLNQFMMPRFDAEIKVELERRC